MCYGVKISLRKQLAFRSAATGFPTKWHTSTKIPRWWCSLTRVCLLTDSFCENWNLRKVLEKIGKRLWKLMLPVIITTHMIIVCGRSGRHKKGRGGVKSVKASLFLSRYPSLFPFVLIPYPFWPTPATQACIVHVLQRVIGRWIVKKIFSVRPGWILIEELSYLTSCV